MRAWDSRADTAVVDEPFYAHYLHATGLDHPGRNAILRSQPTDWQAVVETLNGPVPDDKPIFYQKHMAHHLLPEMDGPWLDEMRHAFLLREPSAMLTSLAKVIPDPEPDHTGLPQQVALFERLHAATGMAPPVIDSKDVLIDPPRLLRLLCDALGVPFDPAMLSWQAGPRSTDGVWAEHWYATVEASTSFKPYTPKTEPVPERLHGVLTECEALYEQLYPHRLH